MAKSVNLVKLCVGTESVEDLEASWARRASEKRRAGIDDRPCHVTRMWPKRGDEITSGGSLYWVFKGRILARQRILELEERIGEDGIRRCALILERELVRTAPQPRRPFQGWRYLSNEDAPRDLEGSRTGSELPPELEAELVSIGVL